MAGSPGVVGGGARIRTLGPLMQPHLSDALIGRSLVRYPGHPLR
jgi:hypothetical protein